MNWLLAVNILIFVVISGAFIAGYLFFRRIENEIREFLSAPGNGQPSPLTQTFDSFATLLARSMAVEVKTTIGGIMSGKVRGEAATEGDIAMADMAIDSPVLAGVIDMLPKSVRKAAKRNPEVARFIMDKVANSIGSQSSKVLNITTGSGNGSRPKFNL